MKFYTNIESVDSLTVTGSITANNYPPAVSGNNQISISYTYEKHKLPKYHLNVSGVVSGQDIIWTVKTEADDVLFTYTGVAGDAISESFATGLYESPTFSGWCGTTKFNVSVDGNETEMTVNNLGVSDIRSQVIGYAHTGLTLPSLTPVIISSATELSIKTALEVPNPYVTFSPTIAGSTITLTEIMYNDVVNGVLDGRERNITITEYDTKFDDAQNVIVAYMNFVDVDALVDSSHLAFRNFTTISYVAVLNCTFNNAPDEACSFGWSQENSIYFSVQNCKFLNTDKGSLVDFGTGLPLEGGNYYGTYYQNYFYKVKQRQPMLRNGIGYLIQNVHEDFADANGDGTAVSPADGASFYCLNMCVKPASVGTPDFAGTSFVSPRNRVTSITPTGNMKIVGAYGMVSDDTLKTGIWTEKNPELVAGIPVGHNIPEITYDADDTLYEFVIANAGYLT